MFLLRFCFFSEFAPISAKICRCGGSRDRFIRKILPAFAEKHFGSAEYRALSPVMKESYKKIVNEDLREVASRVENEVLILEGLSDKTTPKQEAEVYQKVMKKATLRFLDGGHFAFAEHPLTFNLLAEEFFFL